MKLQHIFLYLILILCFTTPVNAANETFIIQKAVMTVYGEGYYANNIPLPIGTEIIAKDQFNSTLGKYTITRTGKIGNNIGYTDFNINVWRNQSDKANRSMPIYVSFLVDGIPTKSSLPFKQNEEIEFNIISQGLPLSPTTITTTQITTIETTISTTTTTSSNQSTNPQQTPPSNNMEIIKYGIIGTIIVVCAILVAGCIATYLINKTSRDDVLHPNEDWDDKLE